MIDYLLCPSVRPGDGRGHVARMMRLHKQLDHSCLYIPQDRSDALLKSIPALADCRVVHSPGIPRLIVLDMPWIDEDVLADLQGRSPIVAIDLGGSGRLFSSYLIDVFPYPGHRQHQRHFRKPGLPPLRHNNAPNLFQPALLFEPQDTPAQSGETPGYS